MSKAGALGRYRWVDSKLVRLSSTTGVAPGTTTLAVKSELPAEIADSDTPHTSRRHRHRKPMNDETTAAKSELRAEIADTPRTSRRHRHRKPMNDESLTENCHKTNKSEIMLISDVLDYLEDVQLQYESPVSVQTPFSDAHHEAQAAQLPFDFVGGPVSVQTPFSDAHHAAQAAQLPLDFVGMALVQTAPTSCKPPQVLSTAARSQPTAHEELTSRAQPLRCGGVPSRVGPASASERVGALAPLAHHAARQQLSLCMSQSQDQSSSSFSSFPALLLKAVRQLDASLGAALGMPEPQLPAPRADAPRVVTLGSVKLQAHHQQAASAAAWTAPNSEPRDGRGDALIDRQSDEFMSEDADDGYSSCREPTEDWGLDFFGAQERRRARSIGGMSCIPARLWRVAHE